MATTQTVLKLTSAIYTMADEKLLGSKQKFTELRKRLLRSAMNAH